MLPENTGRTATGIFLHFAVFSIASGKGNKLNSLFINKGTDWQ